MKVVANTANMRRDTWTRGTARRFGSKESQGLMPDDQFQKTPETYPQVARRVTKEREMFPQIVAESLNAFNALLHEAQEKNPDYKAIKIATTGLIAGPPSVHPQVEVWVDEADAQKTYQLLLQLTGVEVLYHHPPLETLGVNRNNVRQFTWAFKPIPEIYEGYIYTKQSGRGRTDPIPMPQEEMLKHIKPYVIRLVMRTHGDAEKRAVILEEINDGLQAAAKKIPGADKVGLKAVLSPSKAAQDEIYIQIPGNAIYKGNQILNLGLPGYAQRDVSSQLGWVSKPKWIQGLQKMLLSKNPVSGIFDIRMPSMIVDKAKPVREWLDYHNGVNHALSYDSKKFPGFRIRVHIQDASIQTFGG